MTPVTLESFEILPTNWLKSKRGNFSINNTKCKSSNRFERLKKELHLTDLNNEEKECLLKTIVKFPYAIFLEGNTLGCTDVLKHKINIIDDAPVNKITTSTQSFIRK